MTQDYFYTLAPQPPVVGYEYKKHATLQAQGYFALANAETLLTVPDPIRPLVKQLAAIDANTADTILEYDLDQVINNQLGTPAVFKALTMPHNVQRTLDLMWQISGLTPHKLPDLPAGTRYTHVGAFVNRPNSGLRLNVSGGGHYIKQFITAHGGNAYWFDQFEHYHANYMATCDFVNGAVTNLRLEIHRGNDLKEVPELRNDPWVQQALEHCQSKIHENYSNNLPRVIISHYKVGANTADLDNNYLKMYTQAQWSNPAKY